MKLNLVHEFSEQRGFYLNRSGSRRLNMPYIDVLIDDAKIVESCIVDTGASICVFGKNCADIFEQKKNIDIFPVKYGQGNEVDLPVYQVNLEIKGNIFESRVVYDKNANFSLLGHLDFFDKHFDLIIFNFNKNKRGLKSNFRLVSKY